MDVYPSSARGSWERNAVTCALLRYDRVSDEMGGGLALVFVSSSEADSSSEEKRSSASNVGGGCCCEGFDRVLTCAKSNCVNVNSRGRVSNKWS